MIFYVDTNAFRDGDGSETRPFKTINDAAKIAKAGDEVVVRPGIYREHVIPVNSGTEDARITYRSEKPLEAVITGAELITGWKKEKGTVWSARISNSIFGDFNPYKERVYGDWYFSPKIRHTGSVFINDLMMYETDSLSECEKGEPDPFAWHPKEAMYLWYTEQDKDETVIYANFHKLDPNKEKTEITVRRNCFMPDQNGINYITVSGFDITKAATTWAPPAAYQDGMIGPHWSKGWIIEDCEISNSRCCGISLGKYLDPENDMYFTKHHVKSPTQMERDAVCRGQYHGWLKENIGHHIVRRCNIHHCEQTGIVGRMGGVFSTIEDCHIHHICNSQQLGGAETAGIKLHAAIDVTIRRNHIHDCIMGVWLDWQAQGARVTQNFMHDNCRPEGIEQAPGAMFNTDVFIEVGHGPTLIDNNLLLSPVSITIPSEGIAVIHNLILGSFSLINSGVDSIVNDQREPRYTPYHIRHRTEVAGFMTILHGDDRIYNNIFVQQYKITNKEKTAADADYEVVGTAPFDIFPTYEEWNDQFDFEKNPDMGGLAKAHFGHLPVWVDGNAYFGGATVYHKENNKLVDTKSKVSVSITEKSGSWFIKSDLFNKLGDFSCDILTTESLGKAFEPEQYFENPDGTPITFDKDYFGAHRDPSAIPGPFLAGGNSKEILVYKD
ncbi:right-handed parallel beta-helix repeat-containing protein [Butyrivibrio sp. WCE2006]|uniref:right-handed parallel beta-helix repeat-containing protein n=1 Tax=Butyrivibrio sp. WCE2006 TaxID=1410611 RepID=UPI0005D2B417|nr:right-handed parallel beta-helix repeat-containing protein [Butyrivibrio sp. WCE2006]